MYLCAEGDARAGGLILHLYAVNIEGTPVHWTQNIFNLLLSSGSAESVYQCVNFSLRRTRHQETVNIHVLCNFLQRSFHAFSYEAGYLCLEQGSPERQETHRLSMLSACFSRLLVFFQKLSVHVGCSWDVGGVPQNPGVAVPRRLGAPENQGFKTTAAGYPNTSEYR